jgi:hypothetical protein
MIACNAVKDSSTVMNAFMEKNGAHKDVMHTWNPLGMMGGGKACVSCKFVGSVLKESVFDT